MADSWKALSVLIAGCGSIGKRHARVLTGLGVGDIRACDPIASQRDGLHRESPQVSILENFEEGLAGKPDAVLIGTPPKMHVPMAIQALEAGCHVLSEKPISDSLAGVDDLEKLANRLGKKLMVALCFRYHEGLVKAKSYLEEGRIGRLVSIRALMGENLPEVRPDYRDLYTVKYTGAFDLMHDIDLAIWFADRSVTAVKGFCGVLSDLEFQAPDTAEILIGFGKSCIASVHLDFFQRPRRRQIELIGTEGVIIVEFARWERCTVSTYSVSVGHWGHEEMATDRDDMFRAEDMEFLEAVAGNKRIINTVSEAKKSVQVVDVAQKMNLE